MSLTVEHVARPFVDRAYASRHLPRSQGLDWIDLALIAVFFAGIYTNYPIPVSKTVPFPSAPAGVAGVLLAPLLNVSATMGTTIGLKAFAVAIIGGIESARGIIVAGILYGVFEAVVAGYLGTGVREILGFGLVILVLLARPWGLFGAPALRRV